MHFDILHYREYVRTQPVDIACNRIALLLRESNLYVLRTLNAIVYPNDTYLLDDAQKRALVLQATRQAYMTMDIIRELLIDGFLRRLRDQSSHTSIDDDLTHIVLHLPNYAIDMSDIAEIIDETDETITLNGYIGGANQIVQFVGSEAQTVKGKFTAHRASSEHDGEEHAATDQPSSDMGEEQDGSAAFSGGEGDLPF